MQSLVTRFKEHYGMALVFAGALLLIVSLMVGWTRYNSVLLTSLFLIIIGIFLHVRRIKQSGKY
jgi:hypothetical protein